MSDLFGDSSSDDVDYEEANDRVGDSSSDDEDNDGNLFGDSSSSSDDEDYDGNNEERMFNESQERRFNSILQRIKSNDRYLRYLERDGQSNFIQDITKERWEEIGNDIANNTHLTDLSLPNGTLNDLRMTFLFRGMTGSSSLKRLELHKNNLSAVGARSMVPFLQNAINLVKLDLSDNNNIQSEGFNAMFRGLRNSPIETLYCNKCGITSIEIRCIPKHLKHLSLEKNSINVDGCRGLAKLLEGGDATLERLYIDRNEIDDEGVDILVDVLRKNTSLKQLILKGNKRISRHGNIMLLKLVNDISSIEATLQSNHTLTCLKVSDEKEEREIQTYIDNATNINDKASREEARRMFLNRNNLPSSLSRMAERMIYNSSLPADEEKMFQTQLHSKRRAQLEKIQGVNHSVYSEINPLHLPEVLSKICSMHGRTELYAALKLSLLELISTVNRKAYILQQRDFCVARLEKLKTLFSAKIASLNAELAAIEAAERDAVNVESECRSSKRRRQA